MINTVNIKSQQLRNGFFKTGNGPEIVFIMGSCRVVNYVNYFAAMPQFTVYSIDPFNFNWNEKDERVDYTEALRVMETHTELLAMLRSVKIFIHEWYENAGMFNIKEIYNYGLKPDIDICLPNWNDVFVLYQDIVNFDTEIRKMAVQDYNVTGKLSLETIIAMEQKAEDGYKKFYKVCALSSFPEFSAYFVLNFRSVRLFWTYNHVTNLFTLTLFRMMNEKYFNGSLSVNPDHQDMFANNYTHLTQYDNFEWGEERIKLKV